MLTTLDWTIEEVLASLPKNPDELLAARLPNHLQRRADRLLARIKSGKQLDADGVDEMDRLLKLEGRVVGLKAKVVAAKKKALRAKLDWTVDEIVASAPKDPEELREFKCPPAIQRRASKLLALNRDGNLTTTERSELDRIMELNDRVMRLKVNALISKKRRV